MINWAKLLWLATRYLEPAASESCGSQVIYFYRGNDIPIYVLCAYAKSTRADLKPAERRAVVAIVAAIKEARKEKP